MDDEKPSLLDLVRTSSTATLESLELSRRSEAANLTKQVRGLIWLIVQAMTDAELCRLERERREQLSVELPPRRSLVSGGGLPEGP